VTVTNLSAMLHSAGDLRIEDTARPTAAAGEVVVRVDAVGVCGSDVHYFDHGRIGEYRVEAPMILGHESAGIVVEVGDGVDPSRVGQLVALEPGVPDRTCPECLAGRYNLCPNVRFLATPPIHGSMAEFVAFDALFAHPAPAGLSAEQAAMAEPVSVGVWANRKGRVSPGDRVLVAGAGPIGNFVAQVARAFGASSVTITDLNPYRLEVARSLGLDARLPDQIDGDFDVAIECSGVAAVARSSLRALGRNGRLVLVGMGADTVEIDVPRLQDRELSVFGVFRYANTYPLALDLIASGKVDVDSVVTHRFALAATEEAMTLAHDNPNSLKAIVLPQG
jgi:L-iditol 2-dehydrogenase